MHPVPVRSLDRWSLRIAPDEDLIALWIFALIGDSQWALLQRYLDEWPQDYRPSAKA
jgi:hypothetical protein